MHGFARASEERPQSHQPAASRHRSPHACLPMLSPWPRSAAPLLRTPSLSGDAPRGVCGVQFSRSWEARMTLHPLGHYLPHATHLRSNPHPCPPPRSRRLGYRDRGLGKRPQSLKTHRNCCHLTYGPMRMALTRRNRTSSDVAIPNNKCTGAQSPAPERCGPYRLFYWRSDA